MKNVLPLLLIIPMLILSSCSDESADIEPVVQGTEINKFYFLKANNPNLNRDQYATIENNIISGRLPFEIDIQ